MSVNTMSRPFESASVDRSGETAAAMIGSLAALVMTSPVKRSSSTRPVRRDAVITRPPPRSAMLSATAPVSHSPTARPSRS